ncbi:DgyrCDS13050 [Dimorphilus gyrociliatus]|uniref:DgyrCDS13050 n=1 Tax=Dimorphilus gyrociliatus TaxID=2664684 RepID=A0A7I8W9H4_9ANNE|nr:DgyrCDS13050 [Dimorphilus gyrociliatus]
MKYQFYAFTASLQFIFFSSTTDKTLAEYVCPGKEFSPKCKSSTRSDSANKEYVLIRSAIYGQLYNSECPQMDDIEIDDVCTANVLPKLDLLCSGQETCQVNVPDESLDSSKPCTNMRLRMALGVDYECISAATCSFNGETQLLQVSSPGYILASLTHGFRYPCTFRLKTREGYNLHLRLIDLATDKFNYTRSKNCIRYAHVRDGSLEKEICGGSNRTSELWRSRWNTVDILIADQITPPSKQNSRFLIYYEPRRSCPEVKAPSGGWLKKLSTNLALGCNDSTEARWSLRCENSIWVGPKAEERACPETAGSKSELGGIPHGL